MNKYIREYNKLSDKEKIRRLEWIAQQYASWLDCENWELSHVIDATKYWNEMEERLQKFRQDGK